MCSAYDTIENFEEGKKVGMVDFLPKPVKKKDLESMLKRYLGVNLAKWIKNNIATFNHRIISFNWHIFYLIYLANFILGR